MLISITIQFIILFSYGGIRATAQSGWSFQTNGIMNNIFSLPNSQVFVNIPVGPPPNGVPYSGVPTMWLHSFMPQPAALPYPAILRLQTENNYPILDQFGQSVVEFYSNARGNPNNWLVSQIKSINGGPATLDATATYKGGMSFECSNSESGPATTQKEVMRIIDSKVGILLTQYEKIPMHELDVRGTISTGGNQNSALGAVDGTITFYPKIDGSYYHIQNRAGSGGNFSISSGDLPGLSDSIPGVREATKWNTNIMSIRGWDKSVCISCEPGVSTGQSADYDLHGITSNLPASLLPAGPQGLLTVSDDRFPITYDGINWTRYLGHDVILRLERRNAETFDNTYKLISAGHLNAETFIVRANGKVQIGTPKTGLHTDNLLSVSGKIVATELVVTTDGWADYVFDDNYSLLPLDQLEQSIRANKHLPGIPTTAEVKENGVAIGDMQAKMLKKIEELTLYVIELKKEINTLKKEKE